MTDVKSQTIGSPLGPLRLETTDRGISTLEFLHGDARPEDVDGLNREVGPPAPGRHPHLDRMVEELGEYFAGRLTTFGVPLDMRTGTTFQRRVWAGLLRIPYGATVSYGELAAAIGHPQAARAVGSANGANNFTIVIPCHRVVQSGGRLGGYGGGSWRKKLLLDHEAAVRPQDDPPAR